MIMTKIIRYQIKKLKNFYLGSVIVSVENILDQRNVKKCKDLLFLTANDKNNLYQKNR